MVIVDTSNSLAVRVLGVAIDVEQVGNVSARRNSSSKAQDRKKLVRVVIFDDFSNALDGQLVLIELAAIGDVVERIRIPRISIRGSEINRNSAGDLRPASDVV